MIERPVFVVAPPRAGARALFQTLARSPGVHTVPAGAAVIDGVFEFEPENRAWEGNRLTAADLQPRALEELRGRLKALLVDRGGTHLGVDPSGIRWLDGTPRNALRVPFLNAICPDAYFVYVHRDPGLTIPSMVESWRAGTAVTYPELPGWAGPPWSFALVPGWRELAGLSLEDLVAAQWSAIAEFLLDDLEGLPPERWCVADCRALVNDPRTELERICSFVGLEADEDVTRPLRSLRDEIAVAGAALPRPAEVPERAGVVGARSRELLAKSTSRTPTAVSSAKADSPLRSVYTQSFPQMLERLRSSLLVSTYQTGKLICARHDRGTVNTHFRDFQRPMGLAVAPGRIAIGTRAEVLDYRDFPAVAEKVEPRGRHDACFLPRNKHFTGDIRIHEIAFAEGELWLAATNFSCLATLDAAHSFVPRWTPPFITELTNEDRCHLNGICVIDDRVRYVTALAETNTAGGWRERKADGGILIDVDSGETVLEGLSMPHSPRWFDGRMWVLESGKGSLGVADLEAGTVETVAELPGFTRGLLFAGGVAFVGLSQVRETATFGGLPLLERLDERLCGVWAVDPRTGSTLGFLRFEELVQEVFDVALLTGLRYPEIAQEASDAASQSFVLP